MKQILDSGDRTEFETGAVRDMHEGKGRCDLLPLDTIGKMYKQLGGSSNISDIFNCINNFQETGNLIELYNVLICWIHEQEIEFSTMFLGLAKHFEEGAKKYGENNWQKGIPVKCYIDSAVRHYLKWLRGDQDEPHNWAFCWNILCAIWTCENKPELNDYRKDDK